MDELAGHGITPMLTLYHWDLPQELEDSGGWGVRDTAARFAEYAELVADRLGDRVRLWTTLNEPWCAAFLGYAAGEHAPGRTDPALSLRAAHHLLLAHGLGIDALRSTLPADAQVSITLNLSAVLPGATSPEATSAVRRIDGLGNRLFLDPLFRGHYPADVLRDTAALTDWSFVSDEDLAVIATPIDLLGINYYTPTLVDAGPVEAGPTAWPGCADVRFVQPPGPATAMGWAIDAQGLRDVVHRVHEQYAPMPLMITENGAAFDDELGCRRWGARPRADRLPAGPPRGRAPGDRGRGRPSWILRVVAAGQLRVGLRVREAVRHRPRGLSERRRGPGRTVRTGTGR